MSASWEIREGDCVEAMAAMEDGSIDAVVCDPPYGIGFMGKEWDGHAIAEAAQRDRETRKSLGPASPSRPGRTEPRTSSAFGNEAIIAGPVRGGQDFQAWCETWAREALRVLKPGGHLLAFGGARTYHRLACAVEDAGFEIRDSLMWLYGSGFPKSMNVSLAIDKAQGAPDRGRAIPVASTHFPSGRYAEDGEKLTSNPVEDYEARSPDAERWQGWGTALKPAHEPIMVARKPLVGTVAGNVLTHGTGALNVDGCRIGTTDALGGGAETGTTAGQKGNDGWTRPWMENEEQRRDAHAARVRENVQKAEQLGRWPANVVLSHSEGCVCVGERVVRADGHFPAARGASGYGSSIEDSNGGGLKGQADLEERHFDGELVETWACVPGCPVAEVDEQSGESRGSGGRTANISQTSTIYGGGKGLGQQLSADDVRGDPGFGDTGGASRFFYCAKTSRAERNAGLAGFEESKPHDNAGHKHADGRAWDIPGSHSTARANSHPTVKPIELMRWLIRLVTPPGGTVLDPFNGSGTTGCAAVLEGFDYIGVEREAEYVEIARARIAWWAAHPEGVETERVYAAEKQRAAIADSGQLSIGEAA